jgi:hypothetical protein
MPSPLSAGEIWIKHNTGLKTATKADLDLMYEPKIEQGGDEAGASEFRAFESGPRV